MKTHSDQVCNWLVEEGYTHCFFVAGGNIMHFLNSARTRFKCVPVVHEVAAGIASEYFNETSESGKAFALVTAGPGVTNIITSIAGAWLESRELVVIGGQVKSSDLSNGQLRQNGIQEINGLELCAPITKKSIQIQSPIAKSEFVDVIKTSSLDKPGPVYIEFCLDAQGAEPISNEIDNAKIGSSDFQEIDIAAVLGKLNSCERPVFLIGGGVSRSLFAKYKPMFDQMGIPIMTTWNSLDRIDSSDHLYWGRPNTWGQRFANILLQQSDLIIALGTRLGIQQTGFNWKEFAPLAKIIQVDVDKNELHKGHPLVELPVHNSTQGFLASLEKRSAEINMNDLSEWINFGKKVKNSLPLMDPSNKTSKGFVDPYFFIDELSKILVPNDIIIPCSSGGAFTTTMHSFMQKAGQKVVSNKGLASMGYGLSGAIGAAFANPGKRVILIEGDGGFAQNIQELGTVRASNLPIKIFIYSNEGYASIKMTQLNYFEGSYIGCDVSTGLGLPTDWFKIFEAYALKSMILNPKNLFSEETLNLINSSEPVVFILPIDPDQTYFPKITSKLLENGRILSNPLHLMSPPLDKEQEQSLLRYLQV
jgi:acetolactate synthase-1/2/3 large subunit